MALNGESSTAKHPEINSVLAERSYIKPTEDTEQPNLDDIEARDHFDDRISLLSD